MHRILLISLSFLAFLADLSVPAAGAAPSERRLALVIGNASYRAKALATPVNDAALIAQTLQAAGFDVMGSRDLNEASLRQTFRDFIDGVTKAGPNTVAAVYFAGYGLQLEGENYIVPIDADINSTSDVSLRALRLTDQMHALAALHLKTTLVILDAARASPFGLSGRTLAGGLAWVEPETNMLIAFNAAPGTVAPNGGDSYGPYAKALAEMIREGGLTPANVFDRVRLRVNELTKGAQVPWDASKIESQFIFLERDSAAPPRGDSPAGTAWMRSKPMRSLGADDSYMVALLRDTFDGYADFLADYWNTPMAKRVRAMLATRREAITWRRTYQANVPEAYWSYLKRYPHGPHTADVGRLLAHLGAAIQPPAKFTTMDYDVPSPLPDEFKYIERPALVLDDPEFVFEPPPPSPAYFLEPPPPEFLALAAPAASEGSDSLPNPVFVPLPGYVSAPAYVVASPNSFSFNQTHKTPVISENNNVANRLDGQAVSSLAIVPMSRAGDAKDLAGSPPPPSSAPGMATSPDSQRPPPAVTPEEITAPPNPPLPAMSPTPAVPAANQSLTTARISMRAPTPDNKPRVPPLAITQAPPASGMPTGQPLPVMPSIPPAPADDQSMATARIATRASTSDNLPATRAPSTPGGIPLWARAILSPEAIGSTPLSQPLIDDLILATASIAMRTHTTDDRSPVTGAATRALQASDGVPLSQPLSEMSSLPVVPTDEQLLPTARIATLVRTTDKPPPTPGPEMLAPPATNSIPLLTPAIRSARAPGSIPLPVPRPVTLAPPTTGKVPLPISGPAALQPRAIADQSRQNPPAVSIPPPRAVDSAGQQTAPGKLSSTPALARAPQAVPGVSQPPIQLCPVVNGRRICN